MWLGAPLVSTQQTQLDAVISITHSPDVCIILPCMQTNDREEALPVSEQNDLHSEARRTFLMNHLDMCSSRKSLKRGPDGSVNLALAPCSAPAFLSSHSSVLLVFSSCSLAAQTLLSKSPFRQRTRLSCRERVRDR